ncbi:hypothetical protein [Streptomyces tremellae]|uniref:hypothetical protein n=1 Tax=Streptomyces tremellae TaxID=1124239 RepID=UPI0031EAC8ED
MPTSLKEDVNEALVRAKVSQEDRPRILQQLQSKKSEYGAGIADFIARGNLSHMTDYNELLSQVKNYREHNAVYQTMIYADELQRQGFENLGFEIKKPELGLDLDIYSHSHSGELPEYAWQLKTVQRTNKITDALTKIAQDQLAGPIPHKFAVLDIRQPKSAVTAHILRAAQRNSDAINATVEMHFTDGSITITPHSATS